MRLLDKVIMICPRSHAAFSLEFLAQFIQLQPSLNVNTMLWKRKQHNIFLDFGRQPVPISLQKVSHFSYSRFRFYPGCVLSSRFVIPLSAIALRPLKTAEGSASFILPPNTRPQSLRVGIRGDTPYPLGIGTHTWRVVSNVTWDRVPGPNTTRKEVWENTVDWGLPHQTQQSTGTGLAISRLARPMFDITDTEDFLNNR